MKQYMEYDTERASDREVYRLHDNPVVRCVAVVFIVVILAAVGVVVYKYGR